MSEVSKAATVPDVEKAPRPRKLTSWVVGTIVVVCVIATFALNGRRGVTSERVRNPVVNGAPRPVAPLFGFHGWITVFQVGTVVMVVALALLAIVGWRRHPGNPVVLMVGAVTILSWLDPVMNWATYAVYNPQLVHWPESWPLFSLSPTVQPMLAIGYATFFVAPFFPANWALRWLQRRRPTDSFAHRHPLLTLSALIVMIGYALDVTLEIFLVHAQLYIFSQVVPFGSYAAGKPYQFPLIWQLALVLAVMVPTGVLLHRDDTGRTQAERLAHRVHLLRNRQVLGTFLVMIAVVHVGYLAYGSVFVTIRGLKAATAVACPYPFSEAKVYDPDHFYKAQGQPGPYFDGTWPTWPNLRARGHVSESPGGDRCRAK